MTHDEYTVAWLLRLQGLSTLHRMQGSMARAQVPAKELKEGGILLVAGAFLLTPGPPVLHSLGPAKAKKISPEGLT